MPLGSKQEQLGTTQGKAGTKQGQEGNKQGQSVSKQTKHTFVPHFPYFFVLVPVLFSP